MGVRSHSKALQRAEGFCTLGADVPIALRVSLALISGILRAAHSFFLAEILRARRFERAVP